MSFMLHRLLSALVLFAPLPSSADPVPIEPGCPWLVALFTTYAPALVGERFSVVQLRHESESPVKYIVFIGMGDIPSWMIAEPHSQDQSDFWDLYTSLTQPA